MTERLSAKDGSQVLKHKGKYLSSRVDPCKEGEAWVDRYQSVAQGVPQLVVLGVGSGYHLVSLQRRFPSKKIIAIDLSNELIEEVRSIHGLELASVDMIAVGGVQELEACARLRKIVSGLFVILKYGPSLSLSKPDYLDIETFLTGRSQRGFEFAVAQRPSLKGLLKKVSPVSPVNEWQSDEPLLSIKSVSQKVAGGDELQGSPLLRLMILRELVQ